jgi:hypothetical protein
VVSGATHLPAPVVEEGARQSLQRDLPPVGLALFDRPVIRCF